MTLRKGSQRRLKNWKKYVLSCIQEQRAIRDKDDSRAQFFLELSKKYYGLV